MKKRIKLLILVLMTFGPVIYGYASNIVPVGMDATTGQYKISQPGDTFLYIPTPVNADWNATSGLSQILNQPTIPTILPRSFTNNPVHAIVTSAADPGFILSSTRDTYVNYSITITTSISLSGNAVGYDVLEICATSCTTAANWQEIARTPSGQTGTLVIGLVLNQTGGGGIAGAVPATYSARIRSINSTGTPTHTYNSGQEVGL